MGICPITCSACDGMRAQHVSCEHLCIGNGATVRVEMQCMALLVVAKLHTVQHGHACESHAQNLTSMVCYGLCRAQGMVKHTLLRWI